ncbi:MAG TPA: DUF2069 domain-containing protein [Steroidobacteraceae bacterium]|nr:DUF2069 domain-containing protein [Steroidobacteraceae bacterium]
MIAEVGAAAALVRTIRGWVLALMALIATLLIAWQWHAARFQAALLVLSLAPLLAPLPGLIRGRRYTYAWCSMLTIPYMALGLTELIADSAHRLAPATLLLLAFAWLIALVAYLRVTRA